MTGATGRGQLIHVWLHHAPPMVSHGSGVYLWDTTGKRYLDGCSGAVAAVIGHGVPEIVDAMTEQARTIAFAYRSQFTSQAANELADRLAGSMPGDLSWVFLVNSGSEAVETALRLAVQSWREAGRPEKNVIVSRHGSYHGITLGALAMTGFPARRANFEALLHSRPELAVPVCPDHDSVQDCTTVCGQALADELAQVIARHGADRVAAFIAEPIVGAGAGALVPPPGYYERIRAICDDHEVLFITDEVMTGNGRTGTTWGIEHWPGVVPDIVAGGKGIAGGYTPIAAVCASRRVLDPILAGSGQMMAGHTMSANPLSAATAVAVWDYIADHDLVAASAAMGELLRARLLELADRHPSIRQVRGRGLLQALSLGPPPATPGDVQPGTNARQVVNAAFDAGLLLYPALGWEDAVLIAPPLTISVSELDELIALTDKALSTLDPIDG